MTVLRPPGGLARAATDGTKSPQRENGFSNEIIFNARTRGGRSPVIPPEGADPERWAFAFEPWWRALAAAFAPWELDFARLRLNRTPFAGEDADAAGMDEAWARFAAALREIAAATGFWPDDCGGRMEVHLSLKFYDGPGVPSEKSSYYNLSRDLRLQRYLRGHAVAAARELGAVCPDWFAPFHEISFSLKAPRPSAAEVFAARCARQEISGGAARKLERETYLNPPRRPGVERKRPEREKLYPGWEPLVDDVSYLEIHMDSLLSRDAWKPSWVVFLPNWYHGEPTCAFAQEVNDWVGVNVPGRTRHTYRGIYEFDREEDARAFLARWGDVKPEEDAIAFF